MPSYFLLTSSFRIAPVDRLSSAAVKSFGAAPTVRVTSTESAYFCHRQDKVVVPTTLRKWFLRRQTFLLSINICFLTRNTRKTYSRRSFVVKSCEKWTVTVVASSRLYLWFQSRTSTWVRPFIGRSVDGRSCPKGLRCNHRSHVAAASWSDLLVRFHNIWFLWIIYSPKHVNIGPSLKDTGLPPLLLLLLRDRPTENDVSSLSVICSPYFPHRMYRYSMWPLAQRTRYTADWIGCWVRLCGVPSVAWQERSGIDYDGALVVGRKNLQDEMSRLDLEQDRFDNDSSARAGGGSLIFELQHWSSVLRGVLLGGFFGGGVLEQLSVSPFQSGD